MSPLSAVAYPDTDPGPVEGLTPRLDALVRHVGWALELANDGYWFWDLESPEVEYMSPGFWELFGYSPDEMEHSPSAWQGIIDPTDRVLAVELFEEHIRTKGEKPYRILVCYRHKDGHDVWVICRGRAYFDRAGNPLVMVGCHHDVSHTVQDRIAAEGRLVDIELASQDLRDLLRAAIG